MTLFPVLIPHLLATQVPCLETVTGLGTSSAENHAGVPELAQERSKETSEISLWCTGGPKLTDTHRFEEHSWFALDAGAGRQAHLSETKQSSVR